MILNRFLWDALARLPVALVCVFMGVAKAASSDNQLVPIEDFVRKPSLSAVAFSPDGKRFGALREIDQRMNLVVGDLATRSVSRVTSFSTYDVQKFAWINNDRLVFTLYDAKKGLAEQRGGGLAAVNWDGSEPRELSPTQEACQAQGRLCRQTRFVRRVHGNEADIIAAANDRDLESEDIYRVNTKTGRKTLLTTENPGKVTQWVLDKDDVPRAAISEEGKTFRETFWYRDSSLAPWRKVSEAVAFDDRMQPVAFDNDGSLWILSNLNSDKQQLRVFDAKNGKPGELIAESAVVDMSEGRPIIRAKDHKIVGFSLDGYLPQKIWFDESYAKLQALMDASLPKGNVHEMTALEDDRVLVFSHGDRDPGSYHLYDPKTRSLTEQLRPQDWINPQRMAATQAITYKARDGLVIPAYLTLPAGRSARKLPLIAWIHGGPWARDSWGWNPEVQFLASRGYAVLQPNYRGSTGFGKLHFRSSFKQLGRSMQDDITDGIRKLVEDGVVDGDRICIGGGSYGGYATMMGLVKEPALFRCGIDEAGVVDLIWWSELGYTDFNQTSPAAAEMYLRLTIGDVKTDRVMLEQYSPRRHADQIKAPVLIIHGAGDRRVPVVHAEAMRDALKAAGKEYEWRVYTEEGHGFTKPQNQIDRFERIEAFLKKYIGEKADPR